MYKDILQSVEGIDIYPIISLVIFVIFFVAIFLYVFIIKEETVEQLKNIPLELSKNEINKEVHHG